MSKNLKTGVQMERHFKGLANHYRIEILLLVEKDAGLSVDEITSALHANFKTISQHTRYLVHAGLLQKQHKGKAVTSTLTPYGKMFVRFVKDFQRVGATI